MKTVLCFVAILNLVCARVLAEPVAENANPFEMELFPPEFLISQHEALGLTETQLQDLQAVMQDTQPKFESLKGELEERAKALKDALHQTKPDIAQTEEKLRTMLSKENEMKLLQVHLMLTLRDKLTPEQVEKARQLRPHFNNAGATDDLRKRLQAKFEKLRDIIEARAAGGAPPEDIVAKAREIQELMQSGKPFDAEKKLDALLSSLTAQNAKP
jgi:Spy/CpxP family protein refolding chaperone